MFGLFFFFFYFSSLCILKNNLYLFWTVLSLCCCMGFSRVAAVAGQSLVVVHGPLLLWSRGSGACRLPQLQHAGSVVAAPKLQSTGFSGCGARAQLLHSIWDLPRPGIEPMSPALEGGFFTTEPPGKPLYVFEVEIQLIYIIVLRMERDQGQ